MNFYRDNINSITCIWRINYELYYGLNFAPYPKFIHWRPNPEYDGTGDWVCKEAIKLKWSLSVQFSRSVMSDSLRPHESQHARAPCPSPTPRLHSDSRPLNLWHHPTISSSFIPFSSCPQSLPVSESFPMIQLFTWGGQSTGVLALASFLPKKSQGWSPSEQTGWISL